MRFHLIDRLDEVVPGRSVRARKFASAAEQHWEAGPDGPVMPRPLVLEAFCQAGTWLVMASTDCRRRAALLQVGEVSFTGDVRPGDVLEVAGEVDSMGEGTAVLSGSASVDGRQVLAVRHVMCALLDAGELEDPDDSARTLAVLRG